MNIYRLFVAKLETLSHSELALLRSCVGQPLDTSVPAFDLFTGIWWPLRERHALMPDKQMSWLTATLYALHPKPGGQGSLGAALGGIAPRRPEDQHREKLRFTALLSADGAALQAALVETVRRLRAARVPVAWPCLLDDLCHWRSSHKSPQERWATDWWNIVKGEHHAR